MLHKRLNFRNMIVITICLYNVTILSSCGKEKGIESEEAILLLKEVQSSNGERSVYEYDNQNRIIKCTEYGANGKSRWISVYTYNTQGDLVQYDDNENKIEFTKKGNKITFVDDEGGYTEIELDDQGFPVKSTYKWGNWYKSTTIYTWQNMNLTGIKIEDEWGKHFETFSYTYTYDNKKAPFFHCKTPKWFLSCEGYDIMNNKKTRSEETLYVSYEYTYNNEGFPITEKESNSSITYTYIYMKK